VGQKPAHQSHKGGTESGRALLKKAANLLARRAYSRGDLRTRLLKTAGERQVDSTLDRLEHLKLLNDAEYAYNFALIKIGQENWGSAKVIAALHRRCVESGTIEKALRRVRAELGDETISVRYLRKCCGVHWPPTDPKQIQKLVTHLRRRGFDEDAIFRALREILPEPVLYRFEGE
jgi:SOS response regulatory protein OraA/RecX